MPEPRDDPVHRPLRVVIDARLRTGESGGVESFVLGLAGGLGRLTDPNEEFLFMVYPGEEDYLLPHLGPNSTVLRPEPQARSRSIKARFGRALPSTRLMWPRINDLRTVGPPRSDGTVERVGADVVHLIRQNGFITSVPTIYHPHDLQHLHLPQYFTPEAVAWRERWYRILCAQASMVAVSSAWTKADVERQYELSPDKVRVVPMAPPTDVYERPDEEQALALRNRLGVVGDYLLYPAQTWPHKNHIGLLRALAMIRDRHGVEVPLVAPGRHTEHYAHIREVERRVGLDGQVSWPGFVSSAELHALYAGARAVVIPTLFESASFPLWEAFRFGVPAACSNITSLPEQAGGAALLFDAEDLDGMADCIRRLWTDVELGEHLAARGRERISTLSWEATARAFRAHYRRLANRPLAQADVEALARM